MISFPLLSLFLQLTGYSSSLDFLNLIFNRLQKKKEILYVCFQILLLCTSSSNRKGIEDPLWMFRIQQVYAYCDSVQHINSYRQVNEKKEKTLLATCILGLLTHFRIYCYCLRIHVVDNVLQHLLITEGPS